MTSLSFKLLDIHTVACTTSYAIYFFIVMFKWFKLLHCKEISAIYWVIIVSNKPALIGEYAFSQMEFVGQMTQAKLVEALG